ncbi:hypothetical protein EJ06DRAFT_526853 [Trichodelitschia bisporula]|uniref:Uncharacterized protein n=1 Tax=Trichodelitschia bisporula TaxID=703511 RepID=A0A6G1I9R6_9PEZI|nr:hypothetical protein EJ06DRAFT_526853 [Trichodelitschia bisporula]
MPLNNVTPSLGPEVSGIARIGDKSAPKPSSTDRKAQGKTQGKAAPSSANSDRKAQGRTSTSPAGKKGGGEPTAAWEAHLKAIAESQGDKVFTTHDVVTGKITLTEQQRAVWVGNMVSGALYEMDRAKERGERP